MVTHIRDPSPQRLEFSHFLNMNLHDKFLNLYEFSLTGDTRPNPHGIENNVINLFSCKYLARHIRELI